MKTKKYTNIKIIITSCLGGILGMNTTGIIKEKSKRIERNILVLPNIFFATKIILPINAPKIQTKGGRIST